MDATCEMKLQLFSNQYYEFVDGFAKSGFDNKKILGKFYTDENIAKRMISEMLDKCQHLIIRDCIRIIDPFAGDGRLIKLFLEEIDKRQLFENRNLKVFLWDIDSEALEKAKKSLVELSKKISISIDFIFNKTDAFVVYREKIGYFDICITNPPWGLLKPQKIIGNRYTEDEIEKYKKSIALYDDYMKEEFALSQPTRKFGKWGTNLGRTGTEVAMRLLASDGVCGFVSPASLFNDQVSIPLRKWIFNNYKICNISYYPAELKLFDSADVSSITVVACGGKTEDPFTIKLFKNVSEYELVDMSKEEFDYIKRNQYALPLECGFDTVSILQKFEKLPTLVEYCSYNGMFFTRELDETKLADKLFHDGNIIFAKGYMVDRYSFHSDYLFLDETRVIAPNTIKLWKIVWRDVSRNTQSRRMRATIIEPNHIAGNSLGILCIEKESDLVKLRCILGIMNSYTFEFQARNQLVSNHVPTGIIKQQHIPINPVSEELDNLVQRQLDGENLINEIDVVVAKMFGLDENEYLTMLNQYDIDAEERLRLIDLFKLKE